MGAAGFARLLQDAEALKVGQQERLCLHLARLVCGERVAAIIEQARRPQLCCPRCASTGLWRDGHANGLQRYRCKQCGRTFNALTGTPLARLRLKTRWLDYCESLRDPACTVHGAARQVGVHANTSFRWRHRFLAWVKHDRSSQLQGIVEVAARCLPESRKGDRNLQRRARRHGRQPGRSAKPVQQISIVMARDRSGATIDFIELADGVSPAILQRYLRPKLQQDVLVMSERQAAYACFARENDIAHHIVDGRGQGPFDRAAHIEHVGAYHARFKGWLHHFRGVATHYLMNYLGWHWAIDGDRIDDAATLLRAALGVFRT